jgi:cytochrome c-type biogenesis protein CcmH/NrfG
MTQSKSTSASGGHWTSAQAYVLATICLVVGIAVGYLLRGSAGGDSRLQPAATAPAPATPGAATAEPTPEQMKRMADTQAAPVLAKLRSSPEDPALLAEAGNIYYDAQQYGQAIDYYSRALKVQPRNPDIRTDMGTAYFYLGDADRALKEFDTALRDDPRHGQTMFNKGMVLWQGKGDPQAAVATWEKLLKVLPDYPERSKVEEAIAKAKQHAVIKPGTKTDKPATM